MKRILVSILVLVVVGLLVFGIRDGLKTQARKKREAAYQTALDSYTQVLRPGMTRKVVEDYFHGKNVEFQRMCCVDASEHSRRNSFDDLTKIGSEEAPWFCSEHNVYIAFQFIDQGQHKGFYSANDVDTLRVISVYHWAEGCL
jgi:hypothetical protein